MAARLHRLSTSIGWPVLFAALLVATTVTTGTWGPDLPAHLFRAELFRDHGLVLWNGLWYSGHHTLGYSLLFPPVAALIGPKAVGIVSTVGAVALFDRVVRSRFPDSALPASICFAVSATCNLVIGRLTFALGMAVGLATLLAWQRRRLGAATVLATLTPLASPVAGAFLALVAGAGAAVGVRRRQTGSTGFAIAMATAATAPTVLLVVLFPSSGVFPFEPTTLAIILAVTAGTFVIAPGSALDLRSGAVLLASSSLVLAAVPNALGGNIRRFVELFAASLIVAAGWNHRRALAIGAAGALIGWQLVFVIDALDAVGDRSVDTEFYRPLDDFLAAQSGPPARLEIPFTEQHWETLYVALDYPLARGWERQVDIEQNALFYEETLDPDDYRRWLHQNAVRFVALAAVELDASARTEAELLRSPPSWLVPVWRNPDWTVFEVDGWQPIVGPPADRTTVGPDSVRFWMERPGSVLVREHYTPHWAVTDGTACVAESPGGRTLVSVQEPGWVELRIAVDLVPIGFDRYCHEMP